DDIVDIFSKSLKLLITRDSVYCEKNLNVFKKILSFPSNSFLTQEYSCYILNKKLSRFSGICSTRVTTSLVVPQDLPSITVALSFKDDDSLTELQNSLKNNFNQFRNLYSSIIDENDEENLVNHEAIFEVDQLTNINNYEFNDKTIKMINIGRILGGTRQNYKLELLENTNEISDRLEDVSVQFERRNNITTISSNNPLIIISA
ncbi:hypothetical protein SNEBB_001967, partial [Seison nebaliae]